MSATQVLSEYVSNLKFEKIPGDIVQFVKTAILDSVGNMLGAVKTPEVRALHNAILEYDLSLIHISEPTRPY